MPASWVAEQSCSLVLLSFSLVVALLSILLKKKESLHFFTEIKQHSRLKENQLHVTLMRENP